MDIGAFRTFPDNYVDANQGSVRDVPRRKADDFTEHSKKYYQLPIELVTSEIGKATLKNVEKMEWVNELSYSSFLSSINYLTA